MPQVITWSASVPMLVQRLGTCTRGQMIALLIEEVVETVGVGEGAVAEVVEVEAVEVQGMDVAESASEID